MHEDDIKFYMDKFNIPRNFSKTLIKRDCLVCINFDSEFIDIIQYISEKHSVTVTLYRRSSSCVSAFFKTVEDSTLFKDEFDKLELDAKVLFSENFKTGNFVNVNEISKAVVYGYKYLIPSSSINADLIGLRPSMLGEPSVQDICDKANIDVFITNNNHIMVKTEEDATLLRLHVG